MRESFVPFVVAAGCLCTAPTALASFPLTMTPEDTCAASGVVLLGEVEAIDPTNSLVPQHTGGSSHVAVTRVLVTVSTVYKGSVTGSSVVLRVPGGETPSGNVQVLGGVPKFTVGDVLVVHGIAEGSGNLINVTNFDSAILFRRTEGGGYVARDGANRLISDLTYDETPLFRLPFSWVPDNDDAHKALDGTDLQTGMSSTGFSDYAAPAALSWSNALSAVNSACIAAGSTGHTAQTINHSGSWP